MCSDFLVLVNTLASLFQDAHDAVLERLREQKLSQIAVVIQRVMLGHKDRYSYRRVKGKSHRDYTEM